mmetsp:Transcript_15031/g.38444  ORF Transcript_15031/g.38444 Transcript_15031/m.38444 type:complete len:126 (+) Transcript_15031:177-554(+)
MTKNLVVCIDGSKYGKLAFDKAVSNFDPSTDRVTVVTALDAITLGPEEMFTTQSYDSITRAQAERAKQLLKGYQALCVDMKLENFELKVLAKDVCSAGEAVVQFLEDEGSDAVYVGNRGLNPVQR